jgi:hypothetical protein
MLLLTAAASPVQQAVAQDQVSPTLDETLAWVKTGITPETTVHARQYSSNGAFSGHVQLESYDNCSIRFVRYTRTAFDGTMNEDTHRSDLDLSRVGRVHANRFMEDRQIPARVMLYDHNGGHLKNIHFRSEEMMTRVANALRHAATICSAGRRADPF